MQLSKSWLYRVAAVLSLAAIIPACGGSSGGGGGSGVFSVSSRGGNASDGDGGNGEYIEIELYGGGDTNILSTGSVNTSFPVIAEAPYLGATPLIATTTTMAIGQADVSTPVGGATGLHVPAGVTLTVTPNDDENASVGTKERVWVVYPESVYIEGTVIIQANQTTTTQTADVYIHATESFVIAPGGRLLIGGVDAGSGTNLNGGYYELYANGGAFINRGTIDGTGGDDAAGDGGWGAGGYIWGYGRTLNTGLIDVSGGTGGNGFGGDSGYVYFESDYGTFVGGTIAVRGGDGSDGGGDGDWLEITSNQLGAVVISGTLEGRGGHCTNDGDGGDATDLYIEIYSGSLRVSGPALLYGGNAGPNVSGGGYSGGDGGYFEVYRYDDNDYPSQSYVGEGAFFGGTINTAGGDGEWGGDADYVSINCYNGYGYANRAGIWFVGCTEFNASGGNGTDNGGDGGSTLYPCYQWAEYSYYWGNTIAGNVYNEVPWISRGGDSSAGYGGTGGDIDFYWYSNDSGYNGYDVLGGGGTMTNTATLDVSGGDGLLGGGDGGTIYFENYQDYLDSIGGAVTNTGDWNASGGDGEYGGDGGYIEWDHYDTNNYWGSGDSVNSGSWNLSGGTGSIDWGGNGGDVEIYALSDAYNPDPAVSTLWGFLSTGSINTSGGNGATDGGSASYIYAEFTWYATLGDLNARGGDGVDYGGDGGYVNVYTYEEYPEYYSQFMYLTINGSANCRGGDGGLGGGDGDDFYSDSYATLTVTGSINCGGGNGGSDYGGDADYCEVYCDQAFTVGAGINTSGGEATTGDGGWGYYTYLYCKSIIISGGIDASGGSGASSGGDADYIELWSTEIPSTLSGTVDARGGTAGGADDYIMIDGLELANSVATF